MQSFKVWVVEGVESEILVIMVGHAILLLGKLVKVSLSLNCFVLVERFLRPNNMRLCYWEECHCLHHRRLDADLKTKAIVHYRANLTEVITRPASRVIRRVTGNAIRYISIEPLDTAQLRAFLKVVGINTFLLEGDPRDGSFGENFFLAVFANWMFWAELPLSWLWKAYDELNLRFRQLLNYWVIDHVLILYGHGGMKYLVDLPLDLFLVFIAVL